MRIGVLGTGMVGQAIAGRLAELGHDVVMGAREATNPKAGQWAAEHPGTRAGTFADAAAHAELIVNATAGVASLAALAAAGGSTTLDGKVLVDVSNPLDFSGGMPPSLAVVNTDSLAEQIQRAYPGARVVKTLNTLTAEVMVHPELVPGEHTVFVAGEEAAAKRTVVGLLGEFGWPAGGILDLGGIQAARGLEMYLPLWLSIMAVHGTSRFNIRVVTPPPI
jgi:hypothetical protein